MKKTLGIIGLIFLAFTGFAKDAYQGMQGKWVVDLAATKALPEVAAALKQNPFIKIMIEANAKTEYEFGKDSLTITPTIEGKKSPMPPAKMKVLTNTDKLVVLEEVQKGQIGKVHLTPKGRTLLIQAEQGGEMGPIFVLKKK